MLELSKAVRKPFEVTYVKVTPDNFDQVVAWTNGVVRTAGKARFIEIKTHKPANDRQKRAFLGDYVLVAGTALKVYTPRAFTAAFNLIEGTVLQPTSLDHQAEDSVIMVVDTTRADALLKEVVETSPTVVKKRTIPKPGPRPTKDYVRILPVDPPEPQDGPQEPYVHAGDLPGVSEEALPTSDLEFPPADYAPPSPDQVE